MAQIAPVAHQTSELLLLVFMVGILIVAHGTLGESLIHCASPYGTRPCIDADRHHYHDDPQQILPQAMKLVRAAGPGRRRAGSHERSTVPRPQHAANLLDPGRVGGVAGVNLPMLVRALTYRQEPLKTVVSKAISGGVEGVMQMPPANLKNAATGS
jgi:PTS system ascorbate-specific IIA component